MRERLGKFEVVRLLGRGAMGEVYLGRDPMLGREVALKVITAGSVVGEEAHARFEREAKAAALLSHPNIVTIFEFGEDAGQHYLAMEYVPGEELEVLLRSGKASREELLELLAQVCDGLAYAHEQGVVHRDIKPANILVERRGKRTRAKLMDFGVAQVGPSGLTQAGTWVGTVSYMAPEYLDTGIATPGSDVFALGVILYEIISGGRKPFVGETTALVLSRILRDPPGPLGLSELGHLPAALQAVATRALAKRPEDRFPDAESLATAIRDGLREATEAPRSGPTGMLAASQRGPVQLRVGRGGQCLSLKVALRQAGPGSEIILLPGRYHESVVVEQDVTIRAMGEAGEVVVVGNGGPAIILQAPGAALQGLTLQASGACPAVEVRQGAPRIDGCVLRGDAVVARVEGAGAAPVFSACSMVAEGAQGLTLGPGTSTHLEGGRLVGFQEAGIEVGPGAQLVAQGLALGSGEGVGIRVRSRGQATLDGCSLSGAQGALEVDGEARVQLSHCRLVDGATAGLLALEHSQVVLESCDLGGHACTGAHILAGANVVFRQCRISGNDGFGLSIMDRGLVTMEGCLVQANGGSGLLIHRGATVQARSCTFSAGRSLGVDCSEGGQGVLDGCEISGNAGAGVQVEPGGSLLLVRCTLKEGRDSGLLLLEDSQVTLEECVVHRNARGGILLAREAGDPVLRGGNTIEDGFLRVDAGGNLVRVAPL